MSEDTGASDGIPLQVLTQDEIDEKAWKYTGYRGFASFVASDTEFFVLRRFDKLNARVLLTLQDQLSELEERLEGIDSKYSAKNAPDIDNGTCRTDQPDRVEVIAQISSKLREYSEVLRNHSDLRSYPRAPKENVESVKNWFHNNQGAIVDSEQCFVNHDDLISTVRVEKSSMRHFFESHLVFRLHWLWKKDSPDAAMSEVDKAHRLYVSDERIDIYTTVTMVAVGLFMLIAPLWIFEAVKGSYQKLGTITAFVVTFLGMLSYATVAKPLEALAPTAAYSAVLMVFLQLGNTS